MNLVLILISFVLAAALAFAPIATGLLPFLQIVLAVLLGVVALIEGTALAKRRGEKGEAPRPVEKKVVPSVPEPKAAPPATAEADVVQFLGRLQEKGRLVDFAMEEIAGYSDEQVGAVARVVHQGCREVLQATFDIRPAHGGEEGEEVALARDYDARTYRLVGKVPETPPYRGAVRHRGWKTTRVNLPKVGADAAAREVIAPAEVEIG